MTVDPVEKRMKDSSTTITETLTKTQIKALQLERPLSSPSITSSRSEDPYSTENDSENYESMERLHSNKDNKNWKNKHRKKKYQKISKSMKVNSPNADTQPTIDVGDGVVSLTKSEKSRYSDFKETSFIASDDVGTQGNINAALTGDMLY